MANQKLCDRCRRGSPAVEFAAPIVNTSRMEFTTHANVVGSLSVEISAIQSADIDMCTECQREGILSGLKDILLRLEQNKAGVFTVSTRQQSPVEGRPA